MVRYVRIRIYDFDVIQIQGLIRIVSFPDLLMSLGIRFERFASPLASRDVALSGTKFQPHRIFLRSHH